MCNLNKVRVGIIGLGFIGKQHIEAIRRIPNTELVGVCDPNEEVAKRISKEYGVPHYYSDIKSLISEQRLDVVHNCTPSGFHFEINQLLIDSGINVYCEKPFTLTSKESDKLVIQLNKSGLKGGVNFNYRHNLMILEMRERIKQTQKPFFIYCEYLQDWLLKETDFDWRIDSKIGGVTRAVSDIGSHCFDALQYILDEKIISVEAKFFKKYESRLHNEKKEKVENEDAAVIFVEFESGVKGLIRVSQVTAGKKNDFHILVEGAEQSLEWFQEKPDRLWIGNRDYGNEEIYADKKYLTGLAKEKAVLPNGHPVGWTDAFTSGIRSFYQELDSVGNDGKEYVDFNAAHYIMKLVDACFISQIEQKKINI